MLAAMFSGRGFKMETDETGAYFIDRDGTHFRHILNYLRGAFDPKMVSEHDKQQLAIEADFFVLKGLLEVLKPKGKQFPPTTPGTGTWVLPRLPEPP